MSTPFSKRKYSKSIAGKIIITCLLAFAAIALSLYISRSTFSRILSTVDRLSKPNAKIELVNSLFRNVVTLDQLQRNQALKTTNDQYIPFLNESNRLQSMLDTLRDMSLQNPAQVARIDAMKKILNKRNQLFLRYLKLRTNLIKNDTLAVQVKNLSALIENARLRPDTNLVTTSRATKTIVDTLKPEEVKQSFWNRVFSKRKPREQQVKKQIEEELHVQVDTLTVNNHTDSLSKIGDAISKVEMNRIGRRAILIKKRTELNQTGDMLIAQLMSILDDIDRDELQHTAEQNTLANDLVSKSILNVNAVLVVFILGMLTLIFFIFSDISQSNRYRKQLVIAKEQAEEAGLVKQRFLANMSHELRTPLQTIIGISEQVRNIQQPRRQDLENVYQSSLHLLQIVNEVLDYSRITSGKYVLENVPFNMYRVLKDVEDMIHVQVLLKKLNFKVDIQVAENDWYSGDPFRLKQLLLNLLGNAVKFTASGTVSLTAKAIEKDDGVSSFTFVVEDTGVGMSTADLSVVFNQFEQGSNIHKKPGTGLGLSIVKSIVDMQRGEITVQSTPGMGSAFTCTIDYTKADAVSIAEPITPALVEGYEGHVWIVDDDLFILQLCDTILNKYAVPHTCFSSAHQALETPFPEALKIIFLDVRMAEMDGITLCGMLRARSEPPSPKYVALTAQALPDEREAILQQGFDELVMKPFLEQDFMKPINDSAAEAQNPLSLPIDLSSIYKMTGNDDDMMDIVLDSFMAETEKDLASANDSIRENDGHGLAEALHKLAFRYGQLGVHPLANKLRTMEIDLRNNKDVREIINSLAETQVDIAFVKNAIGELRARKTFLQSVENYNTFQTHS